MTVGGGWLFAAGIWGLKHIFHNKIFTHSFNVFNTVLFD